MFVTESGASGRKGNYELWCWRCSRSVPQDVLHPLLRPADGPSAGSRGVFVSEDELRGQLGGLGLAQNEIDDKVKTACATLV